MSGEVTVPYFRSYRRYRQGKFRYRTGGGYTPPQLAQIYGYPTGYDGTGVKVGILELGGGFTPADQSELNAYLGGMGLKPVNVNVILVGSGTNTPDGPNGADGEVKMDVDVVAGMANGAAINLYFGGNNTADFVGIYGRALSDGCDIVSCSWGGPEDQWSPSDIALMEANLKACASAGMTLPCAAGDNGSGDGEAGDHDDYPGSSIYALCCGGTSNPGPNEVVWNDGSSGGATGGGISALFKAPSWQLAPNINLPSPGTMRCTPDVAGNADPATGWLVQVDGQQMVIGGTSAVSPMWAALAARIQQATGKRQNLTPLIYPYCGPSSAMRDITQGNNGTFMAKVGFDLCTGCGVPIGTGLLAALQGGIVPVPPVPVPPIPPVPPPPEILEMALNGNVQAAHYLLMKWPGALPSGFPSVTFHEAVAKGLYKLTKE